MQKYYKFLRNITELIEAGLISSKDLKKEIDTALKFKIESVINKFNLVRRDEFEVQKMIVNKMQKEINKIKVKSNYKKLKRRTKKAKRS